MAEPYILHMISPMKHVSPFDVNMALDAGFDHVIPYPHVEVAEVRALVQDAMFSRPPKLALRTGFFIGGKNAVLALAMLKSGEGGDVPALRAVALRRPGRLLHHRRRDGRLRRARAEGEEGPRPQGLARRVFGATGVVGFSAAVICAQEGAKVTLVGYDGPERVRRAAEEIKKRFGVEVASRRRQHRGAERPTSSSRPKWRCCAARAGLQVLSQQQVDAARKLLVAADVNAVPPPGIEGLDMKANGEAIGTARRARHRPARHRRHQVQDAVRALQGDDRRRRRRWPSISATPSSLPASSSAGMAEILVVGLSARALSASARRAGYAPLAADFFGDLDLAGQRGGIVADRGRSRRAASNGTPLVAALACARRRARADRHRLRDGLRGSPGSADRLAERWPLLGNSAEAVRAREGSGSACRRFARELRHPASGDGAATAAVARAGCRKRRRRRRADRTFRAQASASVGLAIGSERVDGRAGLGARARQRRRARSCSASARNGPIRSPGAPFRYGGAVRPARHCRRDVAAALDAAARERSSTALRLVGLNSVDFLVGRRGLASDRGQSPARRDARHLSIRRSGSLFALHVEACRGELPAEPPDYRGAAAARIVYARARRRARAGDSPGRTGPPTASRRARASRPARRSARFWRRPRRRRRRGGWSSARGETILAALGAG